MALEADNNISAMVLGRTVLSTVAQDEKVDVKDRIQATEKVAKVAGDMLSRAGAETATKEVRTFDLDKWAEVRASRLAEVEDLDEAGA